MKIKEVVKEDATAGGTSAGAVAAVVAPLGSKKKKKKTEMIRRGRYANSISESAEYRVVISTGPTGADDTVIKVRAESEEQAHKKAVTYAKKHNMQNPYIGQIINMTEGAKKKVKESEDALPNPVEMAKIVVRQFSKKVPWSVKYSKEPYRAMMYRLGYRQFDGTDWWQEVMDNIDAVSAVPEDATAGGISVGSVATSVTMPKKLPKKKKVKRST